MYALVLVFQTLDLKGTEPRFQANYKVPLCHPCYRFAFAFFIILTPLFQTGPPKHRPETGQIFAAMEGALRSMKILLRCEGVGLSRGPISEVSMAFLTSQPKSREMPCAGDEIPPPQPDHHLQTLLSRESSYLRPLGDRRPLPLGKKNRCFSIIFNYSKEHHHFYD